MILDLFAGPGGWDVGLWLLGREDVIGLELDEAACQTRAAAGLRTVQCDVARQPLPLWLQPEGLIASPPCKAFSRAGSREGIAHAPALVQAILRRDWSFRPAENPLVWLALEVGRWVEALRPRWVACEQVPEVLPLWRAYRSVLEEDGYSAWCGILSAEQFGVPQTRERAFLVASLDRRAGPPAATHMRYEGRRKLRSQREGLEFLQPWVSMAEALGWAGEGVDEPSRTVAGSRNPRWMYPDPSGSRGRMVGFRRRERDRPSEDGFRARDERSEDEPALTVGEKSRSWVVRTGNNSRVVAGPYEDWRETHAPHERSCDAPAPTLDGKAGGAWQIRGSNDRPNACVREADEPAPTIAFGHAGPELVLNTGMAWQEGGSREDAQERLLSEPAPGLTAKSGGQWQFHRPSTTIAGDPRSFVPGGHIANDGRDNSRMKGRSEDARKLTVAEALTLQSFPPNYPVQGTKTAKHRQIGDAVPPLLAAHVLAALLGLEAPCA